MAPRYVIERQLPDLDYDEAKTRVTDALAGEGFGVLTEIDVKATLKKKLDVEHPRYVILGACNPEMAHRALQAEPHLGALLPCNVIVAERDQGGSTVFAFRPTTGFELVDNPDVSNIAEQVERMVTRALDAL